MNLLSRFIFENSPWGPFWTALFAGYAELGFDGRLHLTRAGAEYLEAQTR
jgi:hypothetical protein